MKFNNDNAFLLRDGHGVIELRGDEGYSELLLDFAPWVLQGWDNSGTAGRFAMQKAASYETRPQLHRWMTHSELEQVRSAVANPGGDRELLTALQPFLQLLAPGKYRAEVHTLPVLHADMLADPQNSLLFLGSLTKGPQPTVRGRAIPVVKVVELHNGQGRWYSWDEEIELIPTDRWPKRNSATTKQYREKIRGGERPCVVLLRPDGGPAYVLDGHHKLAAYIQENTAPRVIDITHLGCI